jgi:hypothetical protein
MMLELTCQQARAMVSDDMNGDLDQEHVRSRNALLAGVQHIIQIKILPEEPTTPLTLLAM